MIYKFKGFSLVEVLMTLLIMSLILVLAVPIATRKISFKETDGVVYTYTTTSSTKINSNNCPLNNAFSETGTCTKHEFIIPNGVHYINLTLVAGGGGGGGASGMPYKILAAGPNVYNDSSYVTYISSDIKNLKINQIIARGDVGTSSTVGDYTSGNGGASSAAIFNYEIPSYFYKIYKSGDNPLLEYLVHDKYIPSSNQAGRALYFLRIAPDAYCNNTLYSDCSTTDAGEARKYYFVDINKNTNITLNTYLSADEERKLVNNTLVRYKVDNVDASTCTGGKKDNSCETGGNGVCSSSSTIDNNVVGSSIYCYKRQPGKQGKKITNCKPSENGKQITLLGGEGGIVSDTTTRGQGTSGQDLVFTCVCDGAGACTATSPKASSYGGSPNNESVEMGIISKSWPNSSGNLVDFEDNNLTGGGGSGGNAVRINGFKVEPGETYAIYVGKGGNGGTSGKDSVKTSNSYANINKGSDGGAGSGTSVFKKVGNNETLVFAVIGGRGGNGGTNDTVNRASNNENAGFYYNPNLYDQNNINFDTGIISSITQGNDATRRFVAAVYTFLQNKNLPYLSLNFLNPTEHSGPINSISGITIANVNYLRGFSDFNHPTASGNLSGHLKYKNNVVVEGDNYTTDDDGVYDGFYYRTFLKNYTIGYVGGLGGFSGLGGKAGCGGLFMGNSYGAIVNNNLSTYHFNDSYKDKFVVAVEDANLAGNFVNKAFNVNDYYDGCSNDTPDGQSAVFITPNPKDKTFGQAGAGGGGGGYSVELGPGRGGDGQNGYVMIDWRK